MKTGNPGVGNQTAPGGLKEMGRFQKMNRFSQNTDFQYEENRDRQQRWQERVQ